MLVKLWRDVGEAMTAALVGDWNPERIVTYAHYGLTGSAMAAMETSLGRQCRATRQLAKAPTIRLTPGQRRTLSRAR